MFIKKKIVFFSGNRSDYSIQEPILNILKNYTQNKIFLILSGSHSNKQMVGSTFKNIKKKNKKNIFKIQVKGEFNKIEDINDFNNKFQKKFSFLIKKLKPDFVVLTGDRYETFSAGFAAFLERIPIIHIEGGDMTLGGAYDDVIRHSLSRLSSFHLVTNKLSKSRLVKWDEKKEKIFNIGYPPGVEILEKNFANKKEVEKIFNFNKGEKVIIFTLHPLTNSNSKKKDYKILLKVLDDLSKKEKIIITYPNFDPGYKEIIKLYKKFKSNKNIIIKKNLGKYLYYGILNYCGNYNNGFCMGNSSSGIKEAIFFNCNVLDLGKRQLGRLAPKNVKNVDFNFNKIMKMSDLILNKKKTNKKFQNPYSVKNFKNNILKISRKIFKEKNSQLKKFII